MLAESEEFKPEDDPVADPNPDVDDVFDDTPDVDPADTGLLDPVDDELFI